MVINPVAGCGIDVSTCEKMTFSQAATAGMRADLINLPALAYLQKYTPGNIGWGLSGDSEAAAVYAAGWNTALSQQGDALRSITGTACLEIQYNYATGAASWDIQYRALGMGGDACFPGKRFDGQ